MYQMIGILIIILAAATRQRAGVRAERGSLKMPKDHGLRILGMTLRAEFGLALFHPKFIPVEGTISGEE